MKITKGLRCLYGLTLGGLLWAQAPMEEGSTSSSKEAPPTKHALRTHEITYDVAKGEFMGPIPKRVEEGDLLKVRFINLNPLLYRVTIGSSKVVYFDTVPSEFSAALNRLSTEVGFSTTASATSAKADSSLVAAPAPPPAAGAPKAPTEEAKDVRKVTTAIETLTAQKTLTPSQSLKLREQLSADVSDGSLTHAYFAERAKVEYVRRAQKIQASAKGLTMDLAGLRDRIEAWKDLSRLLSGVVFSDHRTGEEIHDQSRAAWALLQKDSDWLGQPAEPQRTFSRGDYIPGQVIRQGLALTARRNYLLNQAQETIMAIGSVLDEEVRVAQSAKPYSLQELDSKLLGELKSLMEGLKRAQPDTSDLAKDDLDFINSLRLSDVLLARAQDLRMELHPASIQMVGDTLALSLSIKRKDNLPAEVVTSKEIEQKEWLRLDTYRGWRVNFSTGLVASGLTNPSYTVQNGTIVRSGSEDKYSFGIAGFVHTYKKSAGGFQYIPFSFGIGLGNNQQPIYLLGNSFAFGRERRLILSAGLMGGTEKRLSGGLSEGQPAGTATNPLPTENRVKTSWFLSVSWNL